MGVAQLVQRQVGVTHPVGDPGAVLARTRQRCARAQHRAELRIRAHLPGTGAQAAAEAAGQVHGTGIEHHARVRAPPEDRLACGKPGKDALAVGAEQALGGKIATQGQQARRIVQGEARIREGRQWMAAQQGWQTASAAGHHLSPPVPEPT